MPRTKDGDRDVKGPHSNDTLRDDEKNPISRVERDLEHFRQMAARDGTTGGGAARASLREASDVADCRGPRRRRGALQTPNPEGGARPNHRAAPVARLGEACGSTDAAAEELEDQP